MKVSMDNWQYATKEYLKNNRPLVETMGMKDSELNGTELTEKNMFKEAYVRAQMKTLESKEDKTEENNRFKEGLKSIEAVASMTFNSISSTVRGGLESVSNAKTTLAAQKKGDALINEHVKLYGIISANEYIKSNPELKELVKQGAVFPPFEIPQKD